jgi:hypothetical protein
VSRRAALEGASVEASSGTRVCASGDRLVMLVCARERVARAKRIQKLEQINSQKQVRWDVGVGVYGLGCKVRGLGFRF